MKKENPRHNKKGNLKLAICVHFYRVFLWTSPKKQEGKNYFNDGIFFNGFEFWDSHVYGAQFLAHGLNP